MDCPTKCRLGFQREGFVFQNEVGFWPTFFSEQPYQPEIKSVSDIINYVIYFLHTNSGGEGDLQEPKNCLKRS